MALLLLAIAAVVSVDAADATVCVDAQAIEAAWRAISAPSPGRHAAINERADEVHVELRDEANRVVAERVLPRGPDCEALRRTIAVTLASWDSDVHPPDAAPLALRKDPSPVAPPVPVVVAASTPPRARLAWEVDAGFIAGVAGGAFEPGASADVYLSRSRFPLGVRVGVAGVEGHTLALGSGRMHWGRVAATVSPTLQLVAKVVRLELHADALLGALFLRGSGFTTSSSARAFDGALGGGLRASITRWPVTPWVDVSVLGWLAKQNGTATDDGARVTTTVPRLDVWFRVGVAYGSDRGP